MKPAAAAMSTGIGIGPTFFSINDFSASLPVPSPVLAEPLASTEPSVLIRYPAAAVVHFSLPVAEEEHVVPLFSQPVCSVHTVAAPLTR